MLSDTGRSHRGLTPNERQIMDMVCQGRYDKEIALARGRAVSTVKNTMGTIYEKLGARNRAHAVKLYLERN